jgi:hypothetical protein
MVKDGGNASWFLIHRNKKFSTTSLVYGVEYNFKINTIVALIELV